MNNYYYGKSGKGDFKKDDLPDYCSGHYRSYRRSSNNYEDSDSNDTGSNNDSIRVNHNSDDE